MALSEVQRPQGPHSKQCFLQLWHFGLGSMFENVGPLDCWLKVLGDGVGFDVCCHQCYVWLESKPDPYTP